MIVMGTNIDQSMTGTPINEIITEIMDYGYLSASQTWTAHNHFKYLTVDNLTIRNVSSYDVNGSIGAESFCLPDLDGTCIADWDELNFSSSDETDPIWTAEKSDYWLTSENADVSVNIATSETISALYFLGQPMDGMLGSGIINSSSNLDDCGCINISDEGGLNIKYHDLTARLNNDREIVNCDFTENTISVNDDAHSVYYTDNTCTLQSMSWENWFSRNVIPSNYKRIFDVFAINGNIEVKKGASMGNLENVKKKILNVNCPGGHLTICSGIDIIEDTFPQINQSSGSYRYVDTEVSTSLVSSSIDESHIVHKTAGNWVHTNATAINLTGCNDGTNYVTCSNNKYRQYTIYSIGWGDSPKIHQLAPLESEYFNNIGDCISDTLNGYVPILPSNENGVAVVYKVLCALRDETTWAGTEWVDIREAKTGGSITSIDTDDFVRYSGLSKNIDGNDKNISGLDWVDVNNIKGTHYGDGSRLTNITAGNTSLFNQTLTDKLYLGVVKTKTTYNITLRFDI